MKRADSFTLSDDERLGDVPEVCHLDRQRPAHDDEKGCYVNLAHRIAADYFAT